jgi:transposase
MWGHRLAAHTAQVLFGHHRQGFQHDFPSGLRNLVQATEGTLGDIRSIALERTLLRYYRPFLTSAREEESVAAMASSSVAHLKFRLGLLTSRFRAHHPLKACLACIEEDRSQSGWAWWHIDHQYPGVWICLRHGERLLESVTKSNGVGRFQWNLPQVPNLRAGVSAVRAACLPADEHLARLSRLIVDVVDRPQVLRLDFPTLQQYYRWGLEDRSLMTVKGRFYLARAAKEFLDHVMPFRTVGELAALPRSLDEAKAQLTSMLRADRSGTHPLRHLVMVDWLFGSSANLLSRAEARDLSGRRRASDACQLTEIRDACASQGAEVIALIGAGQMSMRAAARKLGVDVMTVMAWAARMGIEASRRPKSLRGDVRRRLIEQLTRGAPKATAAAHCGVSVTTVTALLRTVPGLRDRWYEAQFTATRDSSRRRWEQLLTEHKAAGINMLRAKEPAVYAWLYRNDKEWLGRHLPAKLNRSNNSKLDWHARDLRLSLAVGQAVEAARGVWGDVPLRKWHLVQVMPELKPLLNRLDRLPLTRLALELAAFLPNPRRDRN